MTANPIMYLLFQASMEVEHMPRYAADTWINLKSIQPTRYADTRLHEQLSFKTALNQYNVAEWGKEEGSMAWNQSSESTQTLKYNR